MFRVLYCYIDDEGQPDRTSTMSTDIDAVKLLGLLEKHSEHRICIMSVQLGNKSIDVQNVMTSLKFK